MEIDVVFENTFEVSSCTIILKESD